MESPAEEKNEMERMQRLLTLTRKGNGQLREQLRYMRVIGRHSSRKRKMLSGEIAADDLRAGTFNNGLLNSERDPALETPADVVVFLQRCLVRLLYREEQNPMTASLYIHRIYFDGLHESFELHPESSYPSLLITVADVPEHLEGTIAGEAFGMKPCSLVLTLVRRVQFKATKEEGKRLPEYALTDVLGSVIQDLSPFVRMRDQLFGSDDAYAFHRIDEKGCVRWEGGLNLWGEREQTRSLAAVRHQVFVPRITLVTGREPISAEWQRSIESNLAAIPESSLSVRDRVSAIETVRSVACEEELGWVFQPGALTPWVWGALLTQASIGNRYLIGDPYSKSDHGEVAREKIAELCFAGLIESSPGGVRLFNDQFCSRASFFLLRVEKPRLYA